MKFNFQSVRIIFPVIAVFCFVAIGKVYGSVFEKGKSVVISNVHVVDDDLYVYATEFRVEGTVNGDLCVFAYDSKIQGQVSRAVNIFSRTASHMGRCEGAFRSLSELLTIDGTIGGSATALGRVISLNKGAVIERDFFVRGQDVTIDGTLKGKLDVDAEEVTITGQVGGDVVIKCHTLIIRPPAVFSGNLTYECDGEPLIDSAGVTFVGTVKRATPKIIAESDTQVIKTIAMRVSGLCAAFLFGLILVRLFPAYAQASYHQLKTRFAMSLAAGLLIVGIIVACVLILIMTLITGIAGQVLFSAGQTGTAFGVILTVFAILMLPIASFSALSGAILFYAGRIFIALFVGALVLRRANLGEKLPGSLAMFLGLVLLSLCFWIPIAGSLFYLFVAAVGAGAIMLGIRDCKKPASGNGSPAAPSN